MFKAFGDQLLQTDVSAKPQNTQPCLLAKQTLDTSNIPYICQGFVEGGLGLGLPEPDPHLAWMHPLTLVTCACCSGLSHDSNYGNRALSTLFLKHSRPLPQSNLTIGTSQVILYMQTRTTPRPTGVSFTLLQSSRSWQKPSLACMGGHDCVDHRNVKGSRDAFRRAGLSVGLVKGQGTSCAPSGTA